MVSLTSVKATVGSARNSFSRLIAAVTPAKPPPRITTCVFTSGIFRAGATGVAPNKRSAKWTAPVASKPSAKPKSSQPTSAGKSMRIPSAVHCGVCPAKSGSKITLIAPHIGRPNAAAVIARSAAAPSRPIGCGKANVYAVPKIAPTARPNHRLPNPPTSRVPPNKPQTNPGNPRRKNNTTSSPVWLSRGEARSHHPALGRDTR